MIVWLDHLIFGNGYGLKSPYFDNKFYWLSGELYAFSPSSRAQLNSYQWFHPKLGEIRYLNGHKFEASLSLRRYIRVEVSWTLTDLPKELGPAQLAINTLKRNLDKL